MNILVFGTGKQFSLLNISSNVNIVAFLDNNVAKIGTEFHGRQIVHPSHVVDYDYDYILLAGANWHTMFTQLQSFGVREEAMLCMTTDNDKKKARQLKIIDVSFHAKRKRIFNKCREIVYDICTKLFKKLPVRNDYIIYICTMGSAYCCNPKYIYEYLLKTKRNLVHIWIFDDLSKAEVVPVANNGKTKFAKFKTLRFLYYMSISRYWIVNYRHDAKEMKMLRDETTVLQTWHAAGAFKKFGASLGAGNFRYDYVLCSSEAVGNIYAEALEVNRKNVVTIGLPRTDILIKKERHDDIKNEICQKYKLDPNKKFLLYAPTFRDSTELKLNFSLEKMRACLGSGWQLLLRWHPSILTRESLVGFENFCVDISNENDVNPFLILAHALITDYSSIIFEYALLNRPMIFYAYDIDNYKDVRNFYFEYENFVPGPIAKTEEELYSLISDLNVIYAKYSEPISAFAKKFVAPADGKACQRIIELLNII